MTNDPGVSLGLAVELMGRLLLELNVIDPDGDTPARQRAKRLLDDMLKLETQLAIHPDIAAGWREMVRITELTAAYRSCCPADPVESQTPEIPPEIEAERDALAAYDAAAAPGEPLSYPDHYEDQDDGGRPSRKPRVTFEP